jgi:hypothetical protein
MFEKEMAHFGHFDEFEAYVRTGPDTWDYPTVKTSFIRQVQAGYEIDEPQMHVVHRIFRMAVEGISFKAIKHVFEREGIPTPQGAEFWDRGFFRHCILDDIYRPHSFEEITALVSPEVATRLDPGRRYGL